MVKRALWLVAVFRRAWNRQRNVQGRAEEVLEAILRAESCLDSAPCAMQTGINATHTTHMPLRISEKKNKREALSRAEGPFE